MIKTLVAVRFRGLLAGITAQTQQKKKQSGKGIKILFAVLFLYIGLTITASMCVNFYMLAPIYHEAGMDWMYFSIAIIMALALSLFGGVFMTQSQLYNAKDNILLLSMPIPHSAILMSRMVLLLAVNLLFCALVMVPAIVMYAVVIQASFLNILLQILTLGAVTLLSQGISCLLGWALHWLMIRIHKALASLMFMLGFLGVYFVSYANSDTLTGAMSAVNMELCQSIQTKVWPLFAIGSGCTGKIVHFLAALAICIGIFSLVYWLLSATFLKATTSTRSTKRRKYDVSNIEAGSATQAILFKEWKRFISSPVYLTNCGMGVLMTGAMAVVGVVLREKLMEMANSMGLTAYIPAAICAAMSIINAMSYISAPSVSLEGMHIWILKSMPVQPKVILRAKLFFHILLTAPLAALGGLALAIAYGCNMLEILLCMIVPALMNTLFGLFGMLFGLLWAHLDWISENYPVKQGMPVLASMLSSMAIPMILGACLMITGLNTVVFLGLCIAVLGLVCAGLYRVMTTWGVKKWNNL